MDELLSLSSRRHEQGQVLQARPGTAERGLRQIDQQSLQVVMKIYTLPQTPGFVAGWRYDIRGVEKIKSLD